MYVETRGPTLEELAKIIDGEDAAVAHVDLDQLEKERAINGGRAHGSDEHIENVQHRLGPKV